MKHPYNNKSGHTLVELLVVMAIMALLASLVGLGAQSLNSTSFTEEIYDFRDVFHQARSYAIANNTYVFVGIEEVDGTQAAGITPQAIGVGKVAVAVVASNTGTKLYDVAGTWTTTNLSIVIPLKTFPDLHMADFSGMIASSGGMDRPVVSSQDSIASSSSPSTPFTFNWPFVGANPRYTFQKVVQFDSTGQAMLLPNTYSLSTADIVTTLEIGLLPAHGNVTGQFPTNIALGNQAALQIDGVTGSVELYRP